MSLDIKTLGFQRAEHASTGRPPYNPRDMLKLYLYGYLNRIRSFTHLCKEWGLYGETLVAVDGSKFRASNSKRNNYSEKKLKRHLKYIDKKIDEYLEEIEQCDLNESKLPSPGPEEIKRCIKELQDRKIRYEAMQTTMQETGTKQISTTDEDVRLMAVNNNGVDVCYNVQITVDSENNLHVGDLEIINIFRAIRVIMEAKCQKKKGLPRKTICSCYHNIPYFCIKIAEEPLFD